MKKILLTLLITATFALSLCGAEKKKEAETIDYLTLAAVLIKDGYFDRAETALASVDLTQKDVDKVRFYTLRGLVYLKKQRYADAIADFQSSIAEGQTEKSVYIYIAQAHYGMKAYRETIAALELAGEAAKANPGLLSIKAQCYWKLEEHHNAWDVLDEGERLFPEHAGFLRQRFFYLVELKLFQKAAHYGQRYLDTAEAKAEDYLALGSALRKSGATEKALHFLELAKMKYPGNDLVIIELAHVYLEKEQIVTAAALFEEAARYKNKYSQEASELFRRAKQLYHALYLNSRITDQKEKLTQRLAIFLEFGDFEMAAAMEKALSRVGLLENEELRYALAYALYEIGEFAQAEEHLRPLTRPDLFKKASELRKSMQECMADQFKCQ
jgi:tetratricopeptide (TPR) repeat protein